MSVQLTPPLRQMTPGELKFALLLEQNLNSLPEPEYRQLVVECLMVIASVVTTSKQLSFRGTLVVEHIISQARDIFLLDQVSVVRGQGLSVLLTTRYSGHNTLPPFHSPTSLLLPSTLSPFSLSSQRQHNGPAVECCCEHIGSCGGPAGICVHFYDSAPSGRYGTMSYIGLAVADQLRGVHKPDDECKIN